MKAILKLKQCVLVLVAAMAMTSCLTSEEDPFMVNGGGYVIQEIHELSGDEGKISSVFYPTIIAVSNEVMAKCEVKTPGGDRIAMAQTPQAPNFWITNTSLMPSLSTIPSGSFSITAVNQENEAATGAATILNTTEMKTKLKGSIKFEGKKISAEFNKVENATDYVIVIKKSESSTMYDDFVIIANYTDSQLGENRAVTLEESTYASKVANLEEGTYYLTIAAMITNSTTGPVLYQESDADAIFTK